MLARMDSRELSGWMALFVVHEQEAKLAKDVADSGDGEVYYYGLDDDDEDDGEAQR